MRHTTSSYKARYFECTADGSRVAEPLDRHPITAHTGQRQVPHRRKFRPPGARVLDPALGVDRDNRAAAIVCDGKNCGVLAMPGHL